MTLKIYKWNVTIKGEKKPISYHGYKTKREAVAFINDWNANHDLKVELLVKE